MDERRRDPRTDARFSLKNLLSIRTLRERFALVVLGTDDGVLMAGSQEGRAAERVAAHASTEFSSGAARFLKSSRQGVSLSGLRFQAGGHALCLAVLAPGGQVPSTKLEDMAARVRAILAGD